MVTGPYWPHSPSCGRKSAAGEIQIGERKQREHLRAILGDATIAHLAITELALHVDLYLDQQAIDTTTPMGKLVFQLALLWQILSGVGFPNQFFNDS